MSDLLTKAFLLKYSSRSEHEDLVYHLFIILKKTYLLKSVRDVLLLNPYYPSLYSINNTLEYFSIPNRGLNVSVKDLETLNLPLISQLRLKNDVSFIIITKITSTHLNVYSPRERRHKLMSMDDFRKQYTGISLAIETNGQFADEIVNNKRTETIKLLSKIFFGATILLLLVFKIYISLSPTYLIWFISAITGTYVCVKIAIEKLVSANSYRSYCNISNTLSCTSVLFSKYSKLFGISWANIGLSYFLWQLILLLFYSDKFAISTILGTVGYFSIGIILYSLITQWIVIKSWCLKCLTVQFILLTQLIAILFIGPSSAHVEISHWVTSLLLLGVLLFSITTVFEFKEKGGVYSDFFFKYHRLKNNQIVFRGVYLNAQKKAEYCDDNFLCVGKKNSKDTIIVVTNPFCESCISLHFELDKLFKANPNIRLCFCFMVNTTLEKEKLSLINFFLNYANNRPDSEILFMLLKWFTQKEKNTDKFIESYQNVSINNEVRKEVFLMNDWCLENELYKTPTILFNGYFLPDEYSFKDLKYLLT